MVSELFDGGRWAAVDGFGDLTEVYGPSPRDGRRAFRSDGDQRVRGRDGR